jgi:hypothetical protein
MIIITNAPPWWDGGKKRAPTAQGLDKIGGNHASHIATTPTLVARVTD